MLKLRNGWPQTPPFGHDDLHLVVGHQLGPEQRQLLDRAEGCRPTCTLWPTLKGRKISSMMPAARLESVPCKASPDRQAGRRPIDGDEARRLDAELRQAPRAE